MTTTENQHWAKLPVDQTTMEPADTTEPLKIENADGGRYSITIGPKRLRSAAGALAQCVDGPDELDQWPPSFQDEFLRDARAVLEGAGFTVNAGPTS